jgi:transcriptional regulator
MYVPRMFRIEQEEALDIARAHPFATLIATSDVTHVPLVYEPTRGAFVGHVARGSAFTKAVLEGGSCLAVFVGPHAYISPRDYVSNDQVPTWNYLACHVRGVLCEVPAEAALRPLSRALEGESGWSPDALSPGLLDSLSRAVVAFELTIDSVEGKAKLGQNRPPEDAASAIDALRRRGEQALADAMDLVLQSRS